MVTCAWEHDKPVYRSLSLWVAALMRCDDQTARASMPRISRGDSVNETELHNPIFTLDLVQMMFDLFQIQDRILRSDLELRCKDLIVSPSILRLGFVSPTPG